MSYMSVNRVQLFHASLVWPLQFELRSLTGTREQHREIIDRCRTTHPWARVDDEFVTDPSRFKERHYREFVSFCRTFNGSCTVKDDPAEMTQVMDRCVFIVARILPSSA